MSEEKFSLNGDPRVNYINLILNDMKIFNARYSSQKNLFETARAFRAILLDLPPPGQEFMKDEMYDLVENWQHSKFWQSYEEMGIAYRKVIAWIWPNMLQEYFSAKPRNPQPKTLGE
jgi:hypothetical protein